MATHPMARAFRVGKLTLAALEHTLVAYRTDAPEQVPVYQMLHLDETTLRARANRLAAACAELPVEIEIVTCEDAVGGGSHPDVTLTGIALRLRPTGGGVTRLAERLRGAASPVISTVSDDRVWIHLRTVSPDEEERLVESLRAALD